MNGKLSGKISSHVSNSSGWFGSKQSLTWVLTTPVKPLLRGCLCNPWFIYCTMRRLLLVLLRWHQMSRGNKTLVHDLKEPKPVNKANCFFRRPCKWPVAPGTDENLCPQSIPILQIFNVLLREWQSDSYLHKPRCHRLSWACLLHGQKHKQSAS